VERPDNNIFSSIWHHQLSVTIVVELRNPGFICHKSVNVTIIDNNYFLFNLSLLFVCPPHHSKENMWNIKAEQVDDLQTLCVNNWREWRVILFPEGRILPEQKDQRKIKIGGSMI
jgi:hypothetical protein